MANHTNDERRRQILGLHAQGLSKSEIGRRLGCERTTVGYHIWFSAATPLQKTRKWRAIAVKAQVRKRKGTA